MEKNKGKNKPRALMRARVKFKSIIIEMRKEMNNPEHLTGFEYYMDEMMRIRKEKGLSTTWSNELDKFIED